MSAASVVSTSASTAAAAPARTTGMPLRVWLGILLGGTGIVSTVFGIMVLAWPEPDPAIPKERLRPFERRVLPHRTVVGWSCLGGGLLLLLPVVLQLVPLWRRRQGAAGSGSPGLPAPKVGGSASGPPPRV